MTLPSEILILDSLYVPSIAKMPLNKELYIDDNGYRFENWKDTLNFVKSYE